MGDLLTRMRRKTPGFSYGDIWRASRETSRDAVGMRLDLTAGHILHRIESHET